MVFNICIEHCDFVFESMRRLVNTRNRLGANEVMKIARDLIKLLLNFFPNLGLSIDWLFGWLVVGWLVGWLVGLCVRSLDI